MQNLSAEGNRVANDLAQRYGFSVDAVTHMMFAVRYGNGSMAQFNHPEFAGSGQWMRGGMMMLSDMFNNQLKNRVDSLCNEISDILSSEPGLLQAGSFQSQRQGNTSHQSQAKYIHSATLHSGQGTSVTIWGDPHVVITIDGVTERFDIGYGAGSIALNAYTTINWDTIAYDPANPDAQLPLSMFQIDMEGTANDMVIDADDGTDVVDALTGLTDADIRELAAQLRTYAGLATELLQKNS